MIGIAAGLGSLIGVAFGWAGSLAICCTIIAVAAFRTGRARELGLLAALVSSLLGAWRAGGAEGPELVAQIAALPDQVSVISAPINTGTYQQFVVEPANVAGGASSDQRPRFCVAASAAPVVSIGDRLKVRGNVEPRIDAPVSQQAYLRGRGCDASVFATSLVNVDAGTDAARGVADLRARMGNVLHDAVPGDAGVLLTGLVTGVDAGFTAEREAAFLQTGTTHLTAVSGSNLALVAGILATVGAATIGRHRLPWQALTIAGVWAYAVVAGLQPPALRAAIVVTAALLAFLFGRRPDFVTLILLAAGLMALIDPRQIDSLGFRLSVAASLALAVVLPTLLEPDRLTPVASVLTATAAAQIATLPLLLPVFGTVSLLSIPANLLVVPLVALAMPLAAGAALAGLASQPLAEILAAPAGLVATAILGIVDRLGAEQAYVRVGIPPTSAAIAIAATCLALVLVLNADICHANRPWLPLSAIERMLSATSEKRVVSRDQAPSDMTSSPPPPPILRGEDPTDASAADFDDPEEHPARQEDIHEVAQHWQRGETVP